MAVALAQAAIAIMWIGAALRDRRHEPAARRFFRGSAGLALTLGIGYGVGALALVLLAVRG